MDETLTRKPAYFGALAALTGTNPSPPSNGTNGTFSSPPSNVTSTAKPSKPTFVNGAPTNIASHLIWPVMLVAVLFV
jgi:endo-1,4-beta-xylanase